MMLYTSKPRPAPPSASSHPLSLSLYIPIVTTSPGSRSLARSLSLHPHTAYRRQEKAAKMISTQRPKTSFISIRPPGGALLLLLLASFFFSPPTAAELSSTFTREFLSASLRADSGGCHNPPRQNSPFPCRAPFRLPVTLPRLQVCYLDA